MTTEPKPPQSRGEPLYTVADLRRWARMLLANPNTDRYPCYGHSTTRIAQAAAFDALADGMSAIETHDKLHANKATAHWLWVALSRVAAGEDVEQVMRDYGWERKP